MTEQIGTRTKKPGRGRASATTQLLEASWVILDGTRWAMTLRQLYYRLVSLGDRGDIAFPKTDASYRRLARLMRDARESGEIPWGWLVDNVRTVYEQRTFNGVEGLLRDSAQLYRADLMRSQRVAIQVWAESDSIGSILNQVTQRYTIPTFAARGYSSRGYIWNAATDIVRAHAAGKGVVILHVGDHDPSGEDIFRDLEESLRLYVVAADSRHPVARWRGWGVAGLTDWLSVERIALTPEQIAAHGLPYRPVKASDVRSATFKGQGAVEVEALPVDVLLGTLEDAIESYIDPAALATAKLAEESEREIMGRISRTPVERLLQVAS